MTLDTLDGIQLIALRNELTAVVAKLREMAYCEVRVEADGKYHYCGGYESAGRRDAYNQAADMLEAALEGSVDG